jgi:hypothetical protein
VDWPTFQFNSNSLISCYADCLSTVTTLVTSGYDCPTTQDIGMCGFVAATNIASISGYDEWACDTTGHTTTDPCTGPWTGITCTGSAVTYMSVNNKGLTGSIPVEVGQLSALTYMSLEYNSITGKHCICKVNGVYGMDIVIDLCVVYVCNDSCVCIGIVLYEVYVCCVCVHMTRINDMILYCCG